MITVSHNLSQFIAQLKRQARQEQFALALALTRTAQIVRDETPDYLDQALDRPTPFSKRGVFVQRATTQKLEAVVGFKDAQAAYLELQEEGGTRQPKRRAVVLPARIKLNQYGNIPRAELRRLYDRAKNDKRATPALKKRLGISSKVDLFVGDPGEGLPPGIYKRLPDALVPLVVFHEGPVRYRPRMGWRRWALRLAGERIAGEWLKARAQAQATAR